MSILLRSGIAFQVGVYLEKLGRHERCLIGIALEVFFGHTQLLQTAVFSNVHVGHVEYDLLSAAIAQVEIVGVYRHCDSGRFVLYHKIFIEVALFVGRSHPSMDDYMRSVFVGGHLCNIVEVPLPEAFFKFGDSSVRHQIGSGFHGLGSFEVVATCRQGGHHRRRCSHSRQCEHI